MKLFFILLISIISLICNGQQYSEVVTVDSTSAGVLHSRAKVFVTKAFKDPKYATQLTDDDVGKTVIVKGRMDVAPHGLPTHESAVTFTLTIASKESRYKYDVEDLLYNYQAGTATKRMQTYLAAESAKGITKKQWEKVKGQAKEIIAALIKDLQKHMGEEDW